MQALADLVGEDASLRTETIDLLRKLVQVGTPAMKSRGRKLLGQFGVVLPRSKSRAG